MHAHAVPIAIYQYSLSHYHEIMHKQLAEKPSARTSGS